MERRHVVASVLAFVTFVSVIAWAGPRPAARLNVVGSVTPASYTATVGASLLLQCPGGIVWYRTLTAAELAAGGLVSAGLGMTDGGSYGVLVDFTSMGDPVGIRLNTNETTVSLLGTDGGLVTWGQTDGGTNQDAGVLPCFFSVP